MKKNIDNVIGILYVKYLLTIITEDAEKNIKLDYIPSKGKISEVKFKHLLIQAIEVMDKRIE